MFSLYHFHNDLFNNILYMKSKKGRDTADCLAAGSVWEIQILILNRDKVVDIENTINRIA